MLAFDDYLTRALKRCDGQAALEALLPVPKSAAELKAVSDDRALSLMSLRVFRAGLKHSLVDAKWPAFEEVFHGFEPGPIVAMSDEALEALMADRRLIRHWGKLKSIRANAAAILALRRERGGMGAYLADWPASQIVDLWADLAKRFSQLGGNSGPYLLRMIGKDTFILTPDVAAALVESAVVERLPKTKKELAAAQAAFNAWADESGRPLCQISRILALAQG